MDLWCLLTTLHGSLYAALNAGAYVNGHEALVDDFEFYTSNCTNLKEQSPFGGISLNQRKNNR
jgi:hypothetical protein